MGTWNYMALREALLQRLCPGLTSRCLLGSGTLNLGRTHQRCMSCVVAPRNSKLPYCLQRTPCCNYSVVKPADVSPLRAMPRDINRPPYLSSGYFIKNFFLQKHREPEIKNSKQIQGMRDSCALAKEILQCTESLAKPGITTEAIDEAVHDMCIANLAYPSTLMYKGFPKSVCTSVNNAACHGIPDGRPLEDGDIINIDITVYYNGYHGDTSATYLVGDVDAKGQELVNAARICRDVGVIVCGPGVPFNKIGCTTYHTANSLGYDVIPDFCGHGIGEYFHGAPDVLHFANKRPGVMKEGMTFTVEPIITEGGSSVTILDDGWTVVSEDNSRSAQ